MARIISADNLAQLMALGNNNPGQSLFNAYLFDKSRVVADDDQSAAEATQRGDQLFDARQV